MKRLQHRKSSTARFPLPFLEFHDQQHIVVQCDAVVAPAAFCFPRSCGVAEATENSSSPALQVPLYSLFFWKCSPLLFAGNTGA